jgi:hypothetical protein
MADDTSAFDWIKALAPLATTLIPMIARGHGQQSGTAGLPPEFSQLLQQQVAQNTAQIPLRNAANSMAFSMLPSWARTNQSVPGQATTPSQTGPQYPAGGYQMPGGGGSHFAASLGKLAPSLAMSGLIPGMSAIPLAGPIAAGAMALAGPIHNLAGNQTNRSREDFASQFTGSKEMNDFWPWLQQRVKPDAYQQLYHTAANVIGRNDKAGNAQWQQSVLDALNAGK